MILDKTLKALKHIASKDKSRPVLTGILFDQDKAIATDGFKLMILNLPDQKGRSLHERVNIGVTSIVNAVKRLGGIPYDTAEADEDVIDSETVNIRGFDKENNGFVEVARKIQGNYPEYGNLMTPAREKQPKAVTALGVKNALEAFQALKDAGVDNVQVKVSDVLDPVYMKGKNVNGWVELIIMPVRTEESELANS